MEDILFLIIAGVAFAINTIVNYRKEQKKNAKRVVQPVKKVPQKITPPTEFKTPPPSPREIPQKEDLKPAMASSVNGSFSTIEGGRFLSHSESGIVEEKYRSEEDIYNIDKIQDAPPIIDDNEEIGSEIKESRTTKKVAFEIRDDFKKAIVYSAILERKY